MAATVAIIGALEKEVAQIYDALAERSTAREAGLTVARGVLGDVQVVACTAGMGTVNAAAATQHLLSAYGARTVIFSGIAGGLNPVLHINDVVIGERLRYLDTDTALIAESTPGLEEFSSTPALVDVAEAVLQARGWVDAAEHPAAASDSTPRYLRGTIATGNRFITGALRDAVVAQTGADCGEMEGAAVAHIAAKNGADCLVLRAISDNCDESYDALCERSFELEDYACTASSLVLEIVRRLP
ncbi:5'-methylthioadenosine/S-adenosylhomocysteine nucleosidase [Enorma massiliensis]|uniref:5'-methylthioadenosine/S-adenosylhomocysteine nucleosidase n=1 Tax=Enorma massiliensis TaxID=1472761 RepID=UPI003A932C67